MKQTKYKNLRITVLLASLLVIGCGDAQDRVYTYQELRIESPLAAMKPEKQDMASMADMLPPPTGGDAIEWTTPESWEAEAGSGFRLATFREEANPDAVETTIVRLSGPAGGAEANIARWIGQIGLRPLSSQEMTQFLANVERFDIRTGESGYYVDLSTLLSGDAATAKTILASIIETPSMTVFVKMTGAVDAVDRNKSAFKEFNQSLQIVSDE